MNSRLTLCMTLHIKGDKESKNTKLETKGNHAKIQCVKPVLESCTHRSNNKQKIVATIEKHLMKCLKNMYL